MDAAERAWAAYFRPETYDPATGTGVLRNKLGIDNNPELYRQEYRLTARRELELRQHPELVPKTFDGDHIKAIHRHIFQDVYDWAGEYRTVEIEKAGRGFAPVAMLDEYMTAVQRLITQQDWTGLNADEFARAAAFVYTYVNQTHPFREGNGRAGKLFMRDVAALTPNYRLNFQLVGKASWDAASHKSGPLDGNMHPEELVPVFQKLTVDTGRSQRQSLKDQITQRAANQPKPPRPEPQRYRGPKR